MDPGWKPAAKGMWRALVPGMAVKSMRNAPVLQGARAIIMGTVALWAAFGGILLTIEAEGTMDPAAVAAVLIAISVVDLGLLGWLRNRPLKTDTDDALRGSYTQAFFVGYAISESCVLWSFVSYFLTDEFWIYLLGIPFGLAGFALTAPTSANLRRIQDRIRASGSPLSIVEVLSQPGLAPPRRRRKQQPPNPPPPPPSGPGPG